MKGDHRKGFSNITCDACSGTGKIEVETHFNFPEPTDPLVRYGIRIPDSLVKELEKKFGRRLDSKLFFIDSITTHITTEDVMARNLRMKIKVEGMGQYHEYMIPIRLDALLSEFDRYMEMLFIEVSHQLKSALKDQLGVDVTNGPKRK